MTKSPFRYEEAETSPVSIVINHQDQHSHIFRKVGMEFSHSLISTSGYTDIVHQLVYSFVYENFLSKTKFDAKIILSFYLYLNDCSVVQLGSKLNTEIGLNHPPTHPTPTTHPPPGFLAAMSSSRSDVVACFRVSVFPFVRPLFRGEGPSRNR